MCIYGFVYVYVVSCVCITGVRVVCCFRPRFFFTISPLLCHIKRLYSCDCVDEKHIIFTQTYALNMCLSFSRHFSSAQFSNKFRGNLIGGLFVSSDTHMHLRVEIVEIVTYGSG